MAHIWRFVKTLLLLRLHVTVLLFTLCCGFKQIGSPGNIFSQDQPWNVLSDSSGTLTHCGRDKMAAIFQTTFSNAFSWMKMFKLRLRFYWSLFQKGPLNNIPALVQIMAWRRPGDKPLSEAMMASILTHICVSRLQWVKYVQWVDTLVSISPSYVLHLYIRWHTCMDYHVTMKTLFFILNASFSGSVSTICL